MHNIEVTLTALMLLGLVIFLAPNVLARNRGKILRNIAIWLAVFVVLAFVYKTFGPGHGMGGFSGAMQEQPPPDSNNNNNGNQGFTPPKE